MCSKMYSTRDYEDVLAGNLFLVDVSQATRDHVMQTVKREAAFYARRGYWNANDFPWYLRKELEVEIERWVNVANSKG